MDWAIGFIVLYLVAYVSFGLYSRPRLMPPKHERYNSRHVYAINGRNWPVTPLTVSP
jgi:hypothetical protein